MVWVSKVSEQSHPQSHKIFHADQQNPSFEAEIIQSAQENFMEIRTNLLELKRAILEGLQGRFADAQIHKWLRQNVDRSAQAPKKAGEGFPKNSVYCLGGSYRQDPNFGQHLLNEESQERYLHSCVCMYVCMHVCMYVCTYALRSTHGTVAG